MSDSIGPAQVAAVLPHMRRFARAITGEVAVADLHVATALARVLDLDAVDDVRLVLFSALCDVLREERSGSARTGIIADGAVVAERIRALDELSRQLLLLVKLEGFALAEAVQVLGIEGEDPEALLARARAQIRHQDCARILVIEDEPLIALDICAIIEDDGHVAVGIARSREEAVSLAKALNPELVLADIRLADESSGVDAVRDILAQLGPMPTVFITAYPERLLTGNSAEPTYLITKPFDEEMLRLAIAQAQSKIREKKAA